MSKMTESQEIHLRMCLEHLNKLKEHWEVESFQNWTPESDGKMVEVLCAANLFLDFMTERPYTSRPHPPIIKYLAQLGYRPSLVYGRKLDDTGDLWSFWYLDYIWHRIHSGNEHAYHWLPALAVCRIFEAKYGLAK